MMIMWGNYVKDNDFAEHDDNLVLMDDDDYDPGHDFEYDDLRYR